MPKAEVAVTTGEASILFSGYSVDGGQFLWAQLLIVSPKLQQSGAYYLVKFIKEAWTCEIFFRFLRDDSPDIPCSTNILIQMIVFFKLLK